MTEDSVKELVKEILARNMRVFVGAPVNQNTLENIKSHMTGVLNNLANVLDINHNLPEVRVFINSNEMTVKFYRTNTGQEVSLADWMLGNL